MLLFVRIIFVCVLCLAGGLCALPLRLDIQGGASWRLVFRYLWFRRDISRRVGHRLRRRAGPAAAYALKHRNLPDFLKACLPFFRKPLRLSRLRLKLTYSTGNAAETAILYGGLCFFAKALSAPQAGARPEIVLAPCFSSREKILFDCDISVSMPAAVFFYRMRLFRNLKF
jgi:hypothetical protein